MGERRQHVRGCSGSSSFVYDSRAGGVAKLSVGRNRTKRSADLRQIRAPRSTDPDRSSSRLSRRGAVNRADSSTHGVHYQRRLPVSTTTLPSSLVNGGSFGTGSNSSNVSDGRQTFVPSGVTTIGRFRRTGCSSTRSSSAASLPLGIEQAEIRTARRVHPDQRTNGAVDGEQQLEQRRPRGRRLRVLDDGWLDPGVPDERKSVARDAAERAVVDRDVRHGRLTDSIVTARRSESTLATRGPREPRDEAPRRSVISLERDVILFTGWGFGRPPALPDPSHRQIRLRRRPRFVRAPRAASARCRAATRVERVDPAPGRPRRRS